MEPYRIDVSSIVENIGESVDIASPYPLAEYRVGADVFRLENPAEVSVSVTNTGAGIVASGTVTAQVDAACVRCLCEFSLHVVGEVQGFFVRPGENVDLPEEQEVEFIAEDDVIDLAPSLHAAIVLETPFAPLHDPECAGICSQCGADLNVAPCECEPIEEDANPFAKLRDLLPPEEK